MKELGLGGCRDLNVALCGVDGRHNLPKFREKLSFCQAYWWHWILGRPHKSSRIEEEINRRPWEDFCFPMANYAHLSLPSPEWLWAFEASRATVLDAHPSSGLPPSRVLLQLCPSWGTCAQVKTLATEATKWLSVQVTWSVGKVSHWSHLHWLSTDCAQEPRLWAESGGIQNYKKQSPYPGWCSLGTPTGPHPSGTANR